MSRENNLKKIRKAKHQTQLRLSQKSGVHRSLICFFETGFRTPNISHKRRLAGALGISIKGIWPDNLELNGMTILTNSLSEKMIGGTSHPITRGRES